MRSRYLFALLLLLATACSKQDGDQAKFDSPLGHTDAEAAAAENTNMTALSPVVFNQPADLAVQEPESADDSNAEKKQDEKSAKAKFKSLNDEMSEAMKEFAAKRRAVKSRKEFDELMKSNPMDEMGQKFVDFAKEFKDSTQAQLALITAAGRGSGDAKTEAMKMLMELVEADPDSRQSLGALRILASQGKGDLKSKAMAMLFATTTEDPDSNASRVTLTTLAFLRGEDESKSKAIDQLFKAIDADPTSKSAIDQLVKFATRGDGEGKARAIGVLIDKHINHEKIETVIKSVSGGMPTPEAYQLLKAVSEKAMSSKIKANAIMSRIAFMDRINSYKSIFADADEERLKIYDPEVIEFVNADRDPNEMAGLEKMLERFIKEHESLLKKAEKELFALKYLSIGREAPEIVGLDIDDVEFKLSDYRGKVVFLDFWGDW